MSSTIIWTIAIIAGMGLLLAVILFFVAKRFKVEEDPRIDEVEKVMPGANCGGCGFAGCRAFAEAAVKAPNLDSNFCPVGGNEVMKQVAAILGYEAKEKAPEVAVVRCNGTCEFRPRTNEYDGETSCKVKAALYSGDTYTVSGRGSTSIAQSLANLESFGWTPPIENVIFAIFLLIFQFLPPSSQPPRPWPCGRRYVSSRPPCPQASGIRCCGLPL